MLKRIVFRFSQRTAAIIRDQITLPQLRIRQRQLIGYAVNAALDPGLSFDEMDLLLG